MKVNRMVISLLRVFITGLIIHSFIIFSTVTASDSAKENFLSLRDNIDLAAGILNAGRLKHTVYNNGQLGAFAIEGYLVPELPCGFYRGYGYIASLDIWLGLPEGPWNPPGRDGPTVSEPTINYDAEQSDWGPFFGSLGWLHSGDLTVGDLVPEARLPALPVLATSTLPQSWPEGYLNESGVFIPTPGQRHWPGRWAIDPGSGLEMVGFFTSDQEVYFSITDEGYADRDEQLDQGFPLNVRIDFTVLAFDESCAGDILFFLGDVINSSPHDYRGAYMGIYFDADVEDWDSLRGIINDNEDWMKLIRSDYDEALHEIFDYDLASIYDYRPGPNWRAWTGLTLLETPKDSAGHELGLTDWHWFEWYSRPGALIDSRKELLQYKVMSGDTTNLWPEEQAAYFHANRDGQLDPHYDAWEMIPQQYPGGLDCAFLMAAGPFHLSAGETTQVAFALLMGDDEADVKLKAKTARAMHEYGFQSQLVTLLSPSGPGPFSGLVEIGWEANSITGRSIETVDLWYSPNGGSDWYSISAGEKNDGLYDWTTEEVPDGTRYRIRVSASDGYLPGEDCSEVTFTIDNPGGAVPEVMVLSPNGGERISGPFDIHWQARDADGDPLTIDIDYSPSNGAYWEPVGWGEENDGSCRWNTWYSAAGNGGLIRVTASDGDSSGEDTSNRTFTLLQQRSEIAVIHTAGHGTGDVHIYSIDPSAFTGHIYQLVFTDTSARKLYHVYDETGGAYVLWDQPEMDGLVESPSFDGLRVMVRDEPSVEIIDSLTGWTAGDCNWEIVIANIRPYPSDYEIRFTEEGDTSAISLIPVPFQIYNLTEEHTIDFMLQDMDHSGDWSAGDMVMFTEPLPFFTWNVIFNPPASGDTIDPESGDILSMYTTKPFTNEDTFRFSTSPTATTDHTREIQHPENFTLFQNYPNPFNAQTDIRYEIPDGRCHIHTTLTVYNILGQKVRTLVDEVKDPGFHTVSWNGKDDLNEDAASGMYFYQLNCGSDCQVRRMLLVK